MAVRNVSYNDIAKYMGKILNEYTENFKIDKEMEEELSKCRCCEVSKLLDLGNICDVHYPKSCYFNDDFNFVMITGNDIINKNQFDQLNVYPTKRFNNMFSIITPPVHKIVAVSDESAEYFTDPNNEYFIQIKKNMCVSVNSTIESLITYIDKLINTDDTTLSVYISAQNREKNCRNISLYRYYFKYNLAQVAAIWGVTQKIFSIQIKTLFSVWPHEKFIELYQQLKKYKTVENYNKMVLLLTDPNKLISNNVKCYVQFPDINVVSNNFMESDEGMDFMKMFN